MSLDTGYDSDSNADEEINHANEKEDFKETLSADILVAVPNEDRGNKYTTYFGLLDSGSSGSLADKKITNAKSNSTGKTSETTYQTKAGTFTTSEEVQVKQMLPPQFTIKRKMDGTFHHFNKSKEDTYDSILGRYVYH